MQGLSDFFVGQHGKCFDAEQLKSATTRFKKRHAIFKAWQAELEHDFGIRREDGLVDPPRNLGSMGEYVFFLSFDCCKFCHRCGVRTFPSFGCPPILGSGDTANKHTKANSLSHVCRPCCGSPPDALESEGPKLSTDACYYTPQRSDWPVYDAVNQVFTLSGDASMASMLDLTREEAFALSIVNLYCDYREEKKGKAIPNKKKMSLCRAEWKKEPIYLHLPNARSKAAYTWLLANNPTYARYLSRHNEILAGEGKNDSLSPPPIFSCMSTALRLLCDHAFILGKVSATRTSPSDYCV